MVERTFVAMVAIVAAVLTAIGGCASVEPAAEERAEAAPTSRERPGRLSHGPAGGEAIWTAGYDAGRSVFESPDLPPPTAARLGSGAPGPGYWQQRTDYAIDAYIIPESNRVEASQRITYHNNSPHTLDYLWMQLEQNLWRPDSKGLRASGPTSEIPGRPRFYGGYDISNVRGANGAALEYAIYDTLMRIELPEPIEPGGTFEYGLDFAFEIPPYRKRMGFEDVEDGKIIELAQWFPHVCKYDDVRGWNTTDYLGPSEFYTDFGSYELNVTVPASFVVVATGELQNPDEVLTASEQANLREALRSDEPRYVIPLERAGDRDAGRGTRTWRFAAEDVRTVAVAASDAFVWDAAGVDVARADGTTARVLIQSLYPKEAHAEHGGTWSPEAETRGSTRAISHAIRFYSDFWTPYPYPVMTNVNGPENGMEYPMIMFCGARTRDPFGVTDHEVAHTWFPMVVNTNERLYEWFDEGLNSFGNIYSRAVWEGLEKPDVSGRLRSLVRVMGAARPQPTNIPSSQHWPRFEGTLNYTKPAIGLYLLREVVMGPARFDRAFRAFIERWSFKSPEPADLLRTLEDAGGMDLSWWWNGWIEGTGVVDFAVVGASAAEDGESAYIDLESRGGVVFPVPYRVLYDDGGETEHVLPVEAWGPSSRFRALIPAEGRRVVGVVIDPEGYFPDIDLENNRWEDPAAAN